MRNVFYSVVFLVTTLPAVAQQKYALVIGNGAYTNITKLNNPVNDANDVAAALQSLGFTVDKVLNGSLDQMESAAIRLKNSLSASKNSYGFLFYAGHGVQSNGENYLIPVDANIQSESFLRERAVSVQAVLNELNEAGNELNMVVLDACRDNPFIWKQSGSRGLSVVGQQPAGSIVMYAAGAGAVEDNGIGRNGLFTSKLLSNLKQPGLNVHDIFNKTKEDILRISGGKQRPELSIRFAGASSAYLGARPVTSAPVQLQPTPAGQPERFPDPHKKDIPVQIKVTKAANVDREGRIQAAFIKALAELGFQSRDIDSPYVLEINVTISPIEMPNNPMKFTRIVVAANFVDSSTRTVLVPFTFDTREGHRTQAESDNRVISAAERRIYEEYVRLLKDYLKVLQ